MLKLFQHPFEKTLKLVQCDGNKKTAHGSRLSQLDLNFQQLIPSKIDYSLVDIVMEELIITHDFVIIIQIISGNISL